MVLGQAVSGTPTAVDTGPSASITSMPETVPATSSGGFHWAGIVFAVVVVLVAAIVGSCKLYQRQTGRQLHPAQELVGLYGRAWDRAFGPARVESEGTGFRGSIFVDLTRQG